MKKVLIVPTNTDLNRGDQALTWSSISIAEDLFPKSSVNIFLYDRNSNLVESTEINHQTVKLGYPLLTRILSHPRRNDQDGEVKLTKSRYLKWGSRAIIDLFTTLPLLSKLRILNRISYSFLDNEKRKTYDSFKDLDLLIVKGGGFIHSYGSWADPYVMFFLLFDIFLAKRSGIPVVILPNSVGPIKNKLAKIIVLKALRYAKVVYVRESKSLQFLKMMNIKTIKSPDLGFYLLPSNIDFYQYLLNVGVALGRKKCVAITLRPYRFNGSKDPGKLYETYLNEIMLVIKGLLKDGCNITLLAHTIGPSAHEDDRKPLQKIYSVFSDTNDVIYLDDPKLNCREIEKIYSYFDIVIGTRFHSVIFALNMGTPAIAIAYGGNKAYGIMKDMKLEKYVVPIEDPDHKKILDLSSDILCDNSEYLLKVQTYKHKLQSERSNLIYNLNNILNENT